VGMALGPLNVVCAKLGTQKFTMYFSSHKTFFYPLKSFPTVDEGLTIITFAYRFA